MKRKYVAFDIEIAKDVPGEDFNWKPHRPLGICCAAALCADANEPIIWLGIKDGNPTPQLSRTEACEMVQQLANFVANGYTLLTWNGLGFDFNVLSEETGLHQQCGILAAGHVDPMFHIFCERGFPVALDKAAQGLGIPGKLHGMSGRLTPQLWKQRRFQEVMDYVSQDVRLMLQVTTLCEKQRRFAWMTRRGSVSSLDLPHGWLTVQEALQLPDPDTSWMDNPIPRTEYTDWLRG